jgi:hypothetical protein
MFLSRDGKQHCVTSLLQVCVCALSAPSGELCLQCGCQGEVNEHNLDCEQDDCQITTQLLQCAACNIAFHEECVEVLHWGLSRERLALPWCSECYDEWFDDGRHSSNLQSKGEVTINYSLSTRDKTPTPSGMPLVKTPPGRKQTRHTRDLQRQLTAKPFRPCFKGDKYSNNCGLVSAIASPGRIYEDPFWYYQGCPLQGGLLCILVYQTRICVPIKHSQAYWSS